MAKVAVVYYSSTGHVHQLAQAVAEGAESAGAEVRLRRVEELAPEEVIRTQDAWHEHHLAHRDDPRATLDDLEWADGYTDASVFGAGGNPYGASWVSGGEVGAVSEDVLAAARYQGRRLAEYAARLAG